MKVLLKIGIGVAALFMCGCTNIRRHEVTVYEYPDEHVTVVKVPLTEDSKRVMSENPVGKRGDWEVWKEYFIQKKERRLKIDERL